MFNFDLNSMIFGFLFGSIGFVYMAYGKKMEEYSFALVGILLMVFPYIVEGAALTGIIGFILTISPFILKKYL